MLALFDTVTTADVALTLKLLELMQGWELALGLELGQALVLVLALGWVLELALGQALEQSHLSSQRQSRLS